ncbi:MAG: hypothetical protein LBQ12_10115 [Deltaproteobacteria bacterium]|jgi:hypothetical protein|nr:hypothetical protein [Deltaproteobacteria bacterium]
MADHNSVNPVAQPDAATAAPPLVETSAPGVLAASDGPSHVDTSTLDAVLVQIAKVSVQIETLSSKQNDFSVQLGRLASNQIEFSAQLGRLSGGFGLLKWFIPVIVAIIVGFSAYIFNGKFDTVNGKFDTANGKFDTVNGKFDTVNEKFDTVNVKFDALEARMNVKFDALEARMNGKFDALEARMNGKFDTLEAKVTGLTARMSDFETRMTGLGTRMDTLFSLVMEMRKDIDGLKVVAGAPATSGSGRRRLNSDTPASPAAPGTTTPGPTARGPAGPGEPLVE